MRDLTVSRRIVGIIVASFLLVSILACTSDEEALKKKVDEWRVVLLSLSSDRQGEIEVIEAFIEPSAARKTKAAEYYDSWWSALSERGMKIESSVDDLVISDDKKRATVRSSVVAQFSDGTRTVDPQIANWKKADGEWYRIID